MRSLQLALAAVVLSACDSQPKAIEALVSSAAFSTLRLSVFSYSDDHTECPERPVHMQWSSVDGGQRLGLWAPASEGSYGVKSSAAAFCSGECPPPSRIGVSIDLGNGLAFGVQPCGQRCYDAVCDGTVTLDANWVERNASASMHATLPLGDHLEGNKFVANPPASVEAHGSAAQ